MEGKTAAEPVTLSRFFRAMDHMRRAWGGIEPSPRLSKSQFATLMTLQVLGGEEGGEGPDEASSGPPPGGPGGPPLGGLPPAGPARPVRLGRLARALGQSLPAVSQRITVLEAQGYVERLAQPGDRRVSAVRLTDAGRALLEEAYANLKDKMTRAIEAIGPRQADLLLDLLEQVACRLEELGDGPARPQPQFPEGAETPC